jgi:FkbM family methyltransferase
MRDKVRGVQSRLRIRRFVRRSSWALERYLGRGSAAAPYEIRRQLTLQAFDIDLVLDGGANAGQYASELRANGYQGKIVSFEPVTEPFNKLAARASKDPRWQALQLALGDADGEAEINVSANEAKSSSFLRQRDLKIGTAPASRYTHTERVQQRRLDSLSSEILQPTDAVALKFDVQGTELRCLQGAPQLLERARLVEAEMSLYPLYEDEPSYLEIIAYLEARGFVLWSLDPLYVEYDRGRLIEMDGLFARS